MNILLWHVHGSWTTAFVEGRHRYLLPVTPDRGPDGRGRARTWAWPESAEELTLEEMAEQPVDVVVLQRPHEEELARRWLGGRIPGRDVAVAYLEHNAPQGRIADLRHPMADRDDVTVVHVTHFNARFWDTGTTRTRVIEHGIVDPGARYSGEVDAAAVVINEPARRGRVTGTDLLGTFARSIPLHLFGMAVDDVDIEGVTPFPDLAQATLHDELAHRRLYLHPVRWTSLGLSLIEAMHLAMPIVALATTAVPDAVPAGAGVVSNDLDDLARAIEGYRRDPEAARVAGKRARAVALERFGLDRFLGDWDRLLEEVVR